MNLRISPSCSVQLVGVGTRHPFESSTYSMDTREYGWLGEINTGGFTILLLIIPIASSSTCLTYSIFTETFSPWWNTIQHLSTSILPVKHHHFSRLLIHLQPPTRLCSGHHLQRKKQTCLQLPSRANRLTCPFQAPGRSWLRDNNPSTEPTAKILKRNGGFAFTYETNKTTDPNPHDKANYRIFVTYSFNEDMHRNFDKGRLS